MLSKQASQRVCLYDSSRTEVDRDFGVFAIDWFLKMLALDCFLCKFVKGKAAKKGKNNISSYKIRTNLSFHKKIFLWGRFLSKKTAVGV